MILSEHILDRIELDYIFKLSSDEFFFNPKPDFAHPYFQSIYICKWILFFNEQFIE